jgi:organic radical activating enzyme
MKLDIEKINIYNCDVAEPHPIDLNWWQNNIGELFNNQVSVTEREMMLINKRNPSCGFNCFRAEDQGMTSARMIRKGYQKSHTQSIVDPNSLDITLASDCNLTCTYCTKEFSSAWRRDLKKNGDYQVGDDRFKLNIKDKLIDKMSQKKRLKAKTYELTLRELDVISQKLQTVYISGGEPLLDNNLLTILEKIKNVPNVNLFTGLGVNVKRLENTLDKLRDFPNVTLYLSCENIEQYLEFNRFGIKWQEYQTKIELIKKSNTPFIFHSVLSNLSIFGFHDFLQLYRDKLVNHDFVHTPDFMSINVLDNSSKEYIKNIFINDSLVWKDEIIQSLEASPTDKQISDLRVFLKEFTQRRNINIFDIYPRSFVDWIS